MNTLVHSVVSQSSDFVFLILHTFLFCMYVMCIVCMQMHVCVCVGSLREPMRAEDQS